MVMRKAQKLMTNKINKKAQVFISEIDMPPFDITCRLKAIVKKTNISFALITFLLVCTLRGLKPK